jgi:adenylate cyclase
LRTTGQLERRVDGWHLRARATSIVPASIQELVDLRLGRLSNDSYRLLEVAAVIGTSFSVALLQTVTEWDRGKLLDALDELRGEALVVPAAPGYRFQHTLICQALYQKLAAERRAWLHERVAIAIEGTSGSQRGEQASVLAYHYEQAGDPVATLQYLVRAGDWARRAYALQEALEHYTRALEYARRPRGEHDVDTVISLLERRSQTELVRSNFDAAISDLEQLLIVYQARRQQTREGETLFQIGFAHY